MRLYLLVTVAAASVALVACSKIAKNEAAAAGHNLGVATVAATNSGAGVIPSGRYACDGGIYVDIRGSEYRGPTGEPSGEFRPYVMGTETASTGRPALASSTWSARDTWESHTTRPPNHGSPSPITARTGAASKRSTANGKAPDTLDARQIFSLDN